MYTYLIGYHRSLVSFTCLFITVNYIFPFNGHITLCWTGRNPLVQPFPSGETLSLFPMFPYLMMIILDSIVSLMLSSENSTNDPLEAWCWWVLPPAASSSALPHMLLAPGGVIFFINNGTILRKCYICWDFSGSPFLLQKLFSVTLWPSSLWFPKSFLLLISVKQRF